VRIVQSRETPEWPLAHIARYELNIYLAAKKGSAMQCNEPGYLISCAKLATYG
jgi:hypothetical protein